MHGDGFKNFTILIFHNEKKNGSNASLCSALAVGSLPGGTGTAPRTHQLYKELPGLRLS